VEVRHTPLSRDNVPERLMDLLEARTFSYVWFYRTDVTNTTDRPERMVGSARAGPSKAANSQSPAVSTSRPQKRESTRRATV